MSDNRRPPHAHGLTGVTADDATPGALIRTGHQNVLETFREFAREIGDAPGALPDPDVLRAVIAFLRQGLLPFATWEERHLEGTSEIAADTAFEHAFLNAEVDAFAAQVSAGAELPGPKAADRIRRCVHRIEAVLELHVQKEADREIPADLPFADPLASSRADASDLRKLDPAATAHFLREHAWGILCTIGGGMPYGVPVSYGFDGRSLYLATGPGRKRDNLERDSAVCLTVTDIVNGDCWTSVVVSGDAAPVTDLRGRLHALAAIRRQHLGSGRPSASDIARAARAAVFRITPHRITGRSRG